MRKKEISNKIPVGKDEVVISAIIAIALIVICILCLYPLLYVIVNSLSKPIYVDEDKVWLYPRGFSLATYEQLFSNGLLWSALKNSFIITFASAFVSMIFTTITAYFLSRRPKGTPVILVLILLNLWFKAGLIPSYLNFVRLGLDGTRMALILTGMDVFNVIILKSFFDAIPKELEESATIDGANARQILTKIHLPLSKTALITVSMFYIVGEWNSYFWPMVLLGKDVNKQPLPVLIRKWIIERQTLAELDGVGIDSSTLVSSDTFIYATIVFAMIPMLILYPYAQRFFKKGVMIGSIKG